MAKFNRILNDGILPLTSSSLSLSSLSSECLIDDTLNAPITITEKIAEWKYQQQVSRRDLVEWMYENLFRFSPFFYVTFESDFW